jgi:type VI secretion system secreted protein VgrG
VLFQIDGITQSPVSVQRSPGMVTATFTTTALVVGPHTIMAHYSGDAAYAASDSNPVDQTVSPLQTGNLGTSMPPPPSPSQAAADGPVVTGVQRFGFHAMPTRVVITFDEPLAAGPAQDPANYQIVTLGGPGRGGAQVGHHTPVASALYNPLTHTVTLEPAQRLDVHNLYELTLEGTSPGSLSDLAGRLLDGRRSDVPGSNFLTVLSFNTLVTSMDGPALRRLARVAHLRIATAPRGERSSGRLP